jgi:hypothetical protein
MEWIDSAVERTTAATDLVLALLATALVIWLLRTRGDVFKRRLWAGIFALLAVATLLGAVAHGVKLTPETVRWIWHPIFLSLGWSVGLFLVAVVLDVAGRRWAARAVPLVLFLGLGFYLTTIVLEGEFRFFLIYQGVALGVALLAYSGLLLGRRLAGARWLVLGIALMLMASVVQAGQKAHVHWVWEFDHNGIFHLLLMPAVLCLAVGVGASLQGETRS